MWLTFHVPAVFVLAAVTIVLLAAWRLFHR